MTKLDEHPLPDDYPVFGSYLYVADGKVVRSDLHGSDIRHLKHLLGAKVITNCDIFGRQELLEKEKSK